MIEDSILTNLRNSFSSAIQRIYIQSLGKTYSFREPTVRENSTLAKTVISNMKTQSVVYAATLSLIKNLCLEDDFDPRSMSEFDRLKVIVHLFSNNFFSKMLSIKCPRRSCRESVKYPVAYGTLLKMMDSVDCSDIVYDNESELGKLRVVANFPSTARYLSLLESIDSETEAAVGKKTSAAEAMYSDMDNSFSEISGANGAQQGASADDEMVRKIRMRRKMLKGKIDKTVVEGKDVVGNVDVKSIGGDAMLDLADIYMKRIQISNIKDSTDEYDIDFTGFDYLDTEKVLSVLPMNLFVRKDGMNVIKFIAKGIFDKMNKCVPLIKCPKCGYEISSRLKLQDFFIFG